MVKLGILKSPGTKSSSKPMHEAALGFLGLKGTYDIYECLPEDLESTFNRLKNNNIKGLNVTIPHKIAIINLLDEISESAKLVGAVNTIIFQENGKTIGENTDLFGFWEAMPVFYKENIVGKDIALLGAGGAACACALAFIMNNAKTLKIFGRDLKKLEAFKNNLEEKKNLLNLKTNLEVNLLENINLKNVFVLVNSTSVGMYPNDMSSPIDLNKLKDLSKDSLVYDIVYKPRETMLLKDAKKLGLTTLNGLDMLVLQGAESLKLWLNRNDIPIDMMRTALG